MVCLSRCLAKSRVGASCGGLHGGCVDGSRRFRWRRLRGWRLLRRHYCWMYRGRQSRWRTRWRWCERWRIEHGRIHGRSLPFGCHLGHDGGSAGKLHDLSERQLNLRRLVSGEFLIGIQRARLPSTRPPCRQLGSSEALGKKDAGTCTSNNAVHSVGAGALHFTSVVPSSSQTCSAARHVGQFTWNHAIEQVAHRGVPKGRARLRSSKAASHHCQRGLKLLLHSGHL